MQREIDDLRRQLQLATEGKNREPPNLGYQSSDTTPRTLQIASSTASHKLGETSISGDVLDDLYRE